MNPINNPIKKEEALTCLLLGLLSTIIPTFLFSAFDGFIVALILFLFFRILFHKYDRLLFSFSYGLYLINSTFFLLILYIVNGSPFLTGGDDLLFYTAGKELYRARYDINIEVEGFPLWITNYPAYLFMISFYYELLSWIGLNSLHFYHLTLLKVSLGSVIPVIIYKIGNQISSGVSRFTLFVILMLPTLVLYTASFLRESVISFFFVFGVYIIISKKPSFYKLTIVTILIIIIYFIRPVHAVFLVLFFLIYFVSNRKSAFWFKFYIIFFLIISGLILYNFNGIGLFTQYQTVQNSYIELSKESSQEGSLGLKLYGSNFLLLWPLKFLYYFMYPIPPPIFGRLNLLTVFISLGSMIWYLIVLGFLKSIFRKVNRINPYFLSVYLLFIIAGAVGVSTSKDPRHLIFIYPLIIPIGIRELGIMPKMQLYLFFGVFGLIALFVYIILKFIT
jgi:hypothetical protein